MTPGKTRGLLDFIYLEPRRRRYKICKVSSAAADSDYHYNSHTPGFTGGHRCIDPAILRDRFLRICHPNPHVNKKNPLFSGFRKTFY